MYIDIESSERPDTEVHKIYDDDNVDNNNDYEKPQI